MNEDRLSWLLGLLYDHLITAEQAEREIKALFQPEAPTEGLARRDATVTSLAAARAQTQRKIGRGHQRLVWLYLRYGPMTDEQVLHYAQAHDWKVSGNTIRPRRKELMGEPFEYVQPTGATRVLESGQRGNVYHLTPAGMHFAYEVRWAETFPACP